MSWRKGHETADWHFCTNCPHWPAENYVEFDEKPSGELCGECAAAERAGRCDPAPKKLIRMNLQLGGRDAMTIYSKLAG